jgi:hypothetical protein
MLAMPYTRRFEPSADQREAMALALLALRGSVGRLQSVIGDYRKARGPLWTAAVESTWWIAALDEQLRKVHGHGYKIVRDSDSDGYVVRGVLFARDRHMHQLALSAGHDDTPFFGGKDGGGYGPPFYISPGPIWREVNDLPPPDPRRGSSDEWKDVYVDHMAGTRIDGGLVHGLLWFDKVAADPSSCLEALG